ncbi:MAG: hypothetical protein PHG81_04975 [Aliarcobacter sp.]|nr:hypothetical protein [Aliarcobacter sp.]
MDLAIIGTAFSHLKTSMDIAKLISDSTSSLGEAETKLKLAELISSLADLKMELADIKVDLIDKDEVIRELKNKIEEKESLIFDGKFYLKEGDNIPFCPTCWESNKKAIHLIFKNYQSFGKCQECEVCKTKYSIGE